jgi:hypothetical protein
MTWGTILAETTIFVSHTSDDRQTVGRLLVALARKLPPNFRLVTPEEKVLAGERFSESLARALDSADALLVIASTPTASRSWTGYEVGYFLRENRVSETPIFIALLSGTDVDAIPHLLRNYNYLTIPNPNDTDPNDITFDEGISKLAEAIVKSLTAPKPEANRASADIIERDLVNLQKQALAEIIEADTRRNALISSQLSMVIVVAIFILITIAGVLSLVLSYWSPSDKILIFSSIFGPVAGIVGASLGFYFAKQAGR